MKERGILFKGPMVLAIQSGAKTQTRRTIKNQDHMEIMLQTPFTPLCLYGKVGDRLWVRETFGKIGTEYVYRADYLRDTKPLLLPAEWKWTPSIFMPRVASRILLEITDIRVEKLQDISQEDAMAEGINLPNYAEQAVSSVKYPDPWEVFMDLWRDINGEESFVYNPWVWVVEFKKIEP